MMAHPVRSTGILNLEAVLQKVGVPKNGKEEEENYPAGEEEA